MRNSPYPSVDRSLEHDIPPIRAPLDIVQRGRAIERGVASSCRPRPAGRSRMCSPIGPQFVTAYASCVPSREIHGLRTRPLNVICLRSVSVTRAGACREPPDKIQPPTAMAAMPAASAAVAASAAATRALPSSPAPRARDAERVPKSRALANRSAGTLASAFVTAASIAGGHRVAYHANRRRPLGQQLGDHRVRRRARDWRLAREHLVQHRAERVDVAPRVEGPIAGRLLGAHVLRRAERQSGFGQPVAAGFLQASAMPKSASTASPSWNRMFSGLMSRWTTPCRCA